MAPISPNGPGNPYNGHGHIIPVRSTMPLQPLQRPIPRQLRTARPTARTGRANRLGAGGVHVEPGAVDDDISPLDPTNKFRRRSGRPDQDTITLSERVSGYIDKLRNAGRLHIWAPNIAEAFTWGAQSLKSYISYRFGADRPQYIDARTYGYSAGGGY